MTIFDTLFFNVFQHYKPTQKKKANTIALYYITGLQCSLLLLSGIVVSSFLNEMNSGTMSSGNAWALFIMACIFLVFKNWIQYSGKKRKVLNAKLNNKKKPELYNILLLWALLVSALVLSITMLIAL
jgi:heme/copper-type cytochrome/quinol oxidase subunit 3